MAHKDLIMRAGLLALLACARLASATGARPAVNVFQMAGAPTAGALGVAAGQIALKAGMPGLSPVEIDTLGRLFGAWGLSVEALSGTDEAARRHLIILARQEIRRQIAERLGALTPEAIASLEDAALEQAAGDMAALELLVPAFDAQRGADLAAASREISRRRGQLQQAKVDAALTAAEDPRVFEVEGLARQLRQANHGFVALPIAKRIALVGQAPTSSESARLGAARALLGHMDESYGNAHARTIVDSLTLIALAQRSPKVQGAIARGLGADLRQAKSAIAIHDPAYVLSALSAVSTAGDDSVKRIARDAIKPMLASSPLRLRRKIIEALSHMAVAGPEENPPAADPAPETDKSVKGLLRGWARPALWSIPRMGGLALALFSLAGALGSLPALSVAGAAVIVAGVVINGYAKHHPIAALVHALSISKVFVVAAALAASTGPLGALGYAFTFGFAAAMASISIAGVKHHRVIAAAALLLVLASMF